MFATHSLVEETYYAPQDHFTFFECESGQYDASLLSVSSSEDGVHICISDWMGREAVVTLLAADVQDALARKESFIQVADDGSLWVSVTLPEGDKDGAMGAEVLLSERIDDFFACLALKLELSISIREDVLYCY